MKWLTVSFSCKGQFTNQKCSHWLKVSKLNIGHPQNSPTFSFTQVLYKVNINPVK